MLRQLRIPSARYAAVAGTAVAVGIVFWLLQDFAIQSGDYVQYRSRTDYGVAQPIFHVREPGAVALWQAASWAYAAVVTPGVAVLDYEHRIFGFNFISAASGAAYVAFLLLWIREFSASPGRKAAAAGIVLCSSITWTFVGHVEFYAPFHAGLMFFYWRAAKCLPRCNGQTFRWLMLAALVAATMHRVALFHLPALLVLYQRPEGLLKFEPPPRWHVETALPVFVFGVGLHIAAVVGYMIGLPIYVMEDYNWLPELITPLTQSWADYVVANSKLGSYHLFTFGSLDHLKHLGFFAMVSAPLGIVTIAALGRGRRFTRHQRFLAMAAAAAWLWAVLWHPHLGYGDWNLFSHPGLPTNLLAASLLLERSEPNRKRRTAQHGEEG